MALPTLIKDWQVIANQTIAADATIDAGTNSHRDRRNLLLAIKVQMIATGQVSDIGPTPGGAINNWTVVRSCDSVNISDAPSDEWANNLDLVFNTSGNAHSWIVLEQTGIDTNFQICIDLVQSANSNDGANFGVIASPGGFNIATGTTTARPTPTTTDDEVILSTVGNWGSGANGGGAKAFVWNMWITEDGEVTYVVIYYADNPLGFWIFAKPQSPLASWDGTQFVAKVQGAQSDTTQATNYNDWYDTDQLYTFRDDRISTANSNNRTALYMTCDTFGSGPMGEELTVANQVTGEYAFCTIGLASTDSGFVGKMGTMFDLYWGQDVLGQPADNYPSGGSKDWVQFGALIFPWDGATPVTT